MTRRDRIMVLVIGLALTTAAGWFLLLSPMRDEASTLSAQVATQQATLTTALADVAVGLEARRAYPRDYATVARLGAAVPEDDNVASLLVQVEHAADATDVEFRSLKVGSASGAATAAPPVAPTDPAAATQAATATLPPGALVGPAGFPTMPFAFDFSGDFLHMSDFIGRLERFLVVRNRRLSVSGRFMTIDGISLKAAPKGFPQIAASVAATTYLLPADQGLTGGATAEAPAGASGSGTPSTDQTASSGSGSSLPAAAAAPVAP
jgi:hypothetical protein